MQAKRVRLPDSNSAVYTAASVVGKEQLPSTGVDRDRAGELGHGARAGRDTAKNS